MLLSLGEAIGHKFVTQILTYNLFMLRYDVFYSIQQVTSGPLQ